MLTLYALEVRQKEYQFVLFSSISFCSNPYYSLLYVPIKVSFVLRVTTTRYICQVKFREKKLGTGVRISNPCPLSCLTLPHTLWQQTHTQYGATNREALMKNTLACLRAPTLTLNSSTHRITPYHVSPRRQESRVSL